MDLSMQAGIRERDTHIALAVVVARMLHPTSERAAHAWAAREVQTAGAPGLDPDKGVSLSKLHRIHNVLYAHCSALMRGLFIREQDGDDLRTVRRHDGTESSRYRTIDPAALPVAAYVVRVTATGVRP